MNLPLLPFKPFTAEEVQAITGIWPRTLEAWMGTVLHIHMGVDRVTMGLDWMSTFAVYCGRRYLEEGSDADRATAIVRYVSGLTIEHVLAQINAGLSFPCVNPPMMIRPPDKPLGRRLNLERLLGEFRANLAKVFPE